MFVNSFLDSEKPGPGYFRCIWSLVQVMKVFVQCRHSLKHSGCLFRLPLCSPTSCPISLAAPACCHRHWAAPSVTPSHFLGRRARCHRWWHIEPRHARCPASSEADISVLGRVQKKRKDGRGRKNVDWSSSAPNCRNWDISATGKCLETTWYMWMKNR